MTETTCHNCETQWDYTGKYMRATCPSCGNKTRVPDEHDPEEGEAA